MMRRQKWKLAAMRFVEQAKTQLAADPETLDSYRSSARAAPVLFRRSGAVQALSYLASRGNAGGLRLACEIAQIREPPPEPVTDAATYVCGVVNGAADAAHGNYLLLARDHILIADCFKQMVDLLLPVPSTPAQQPTAAVVT